MDFQIRILNLQQMIEAFARAPEIVAPLLQRALQAAAAVFAQNTNTTTVPFRTGFLLQSFGLRVLGPLSIGWGPDVNYKTSYSNFVEFGTGPHIIVPREARALYWDGADHPVKMVHHPGTRANKFMERILEQSTDGINTLMSQTLQEIMQQIAA